jgi:hypothetical protein
MCRFDPYTPPPSPLQRFVQTRLLPGVLCFAAGVILTSQLAKANEHTLLRTAERAVRMAEFYKTHCGPVLPDGTVIAHAPKGETP